MNKLAKQTLAGEENMRGTPMRIDMRFKELKNNQGKRSGIYIPEDDHKKYTRCVACDIILENKPRTDESPLYCWLCKKD